MNIHSCLKIEIVFCVIVCVYVNHTHVHVFTCKWRIPFGTILIATVAVVTSYNKNIIYSTQYASNT